METISSRPDPSALVRYRWVAPALLLAIALGLAPLWWDVTAPPQLALAVSWRDAAGTLLVPAGAVRGLAPHGRVEAAGAASVFVVQDGVARLVRVRLGAVRADAVEVREGLAEGARVVVNPPKSLEDRHRVAAGR